MSSLYLPLLTLFFLLVALASGEGNVGINYGRVANDLPTPDKVVSLLKSQGITFAKLYDTDPSVLKAFANSGISLVVAMPNENLKSAASSQSFTDTWVQSQIVPFYPSSNITAIAVGNEVNVLPDDIPYLVPAMKNLYLSLQKYSLDSKIKLSSPIALSALESSYPSSAGSFKSDLVTTMIKPMLEFLRKTSSPMMINIYPFFAYAANADKISLDYALFKPNDGVTDSGNGLKYNNMFEAQLDAVYAAMSKLQFNDVKLVVTETGWPSKGDEAEVGASEVNAQAYNGNLVKRVLTGGGTPLKPNDALDVYLFALFNENQKPGPTSERNYGLFYPSEEKVYDVPMFSLVANEGAASNGNASKVIVPPSKEIVPPSKGIVPPSKEIVPPSKGHTWCVATESVGQDRLQKALDYACGDGAADCRSIQPGTTCYNPDSLVAHASYAFNSYYQLNKRAVGTCDFGGAAYVVTQAPRYGNCEFPTGY